jgi:hypothetical protein
MQINVGDGVVGKGAKPGVFPRLELKKKILFLKEIFYLHCSRVTSKSPVASLVRKLLANVFRASPSPLENLLPHSPPRGKNSGCARD